MSKRSTWLASAWLLVSPLFVFWMVYAAAYNAWLTATPLPPGDLEHRQTRAYCYFAAAIAATLLSILFGLHLRRTKKTSIDAS
ncbi:MAG: hypothetical protein C0518_14540 [Opitutus sp.]|nr:hypothetical protein [Opitutus sp.]